eukprot:g173.t1
MPAPEASGSPMEWRLFWPALGRPGGTTDQRLAEVARLKEEARSRSFVVNRAQKTAADEENARRKIEEELLDQKQGQSEAAERLAHAHRIEQDRWMRRELREELANLRTEFETLEQREVKAREIAAGMEAEIDNLLKEAKTAQKTLQQSGLDTRKKHGFWPFR